MRKTISQPTDLQQQWDSNNLEFPFDEQMEEDEEQLYSKATESVNVHDGKYHSEASSDESDGSGDSFDRNNSYYRTETYMRSEDVWRKRRAAGVRYTTSSVPSRW